MSAVVVITPNKIDWETPEWLFETLNKEFCFDLDVCANSENHKCSRYFTAEQNGLAHSWSGYRVWCNPPYGRAIPSWVEKAEKEVAENGCKLAVLLLPARTDTEWFHRFVYGKAEVRFLRGRIKFVGAKYVAPFPSMVVIYRR